MKTSTMALVLAIASGMLPTTASAEDFYAGKQINLIVGSAVGGGYDAYARLVARYWPHFIPGQPSIVVQNLPAAGSLVAMNNLANSAPRDGLTIGAVQNHIGVEPIMGVTGPKENARYDARKMNWLGSTSKEVPVVAIWSNSPIKTLREAMQTEVLVGSSGVATADAVDARLMNRLAGETSARSMTSSGMMPPLSTLWTCGAARFGSFCSSSVARACRLTSVSTSLRRSGLSGW